MVLSTHLNKKSTVDGSGRHFEFPSLANANKNTASGSAGCNRYNCVFVKQQSCSRPTARLVDPDDSNHYSHRDDLIAARAGSLTAQSDGKKPLWPCPNVTA